MSRGHKGSFAELGDAITLEATVANAIVIVLGVVVDDAVGVDVAVVFVAGRLNVGLGDLVGVANEAAGGVDAVLALGADVVGETLVNVLAALLAVALVTGVTDALVVLLAASEWNTSGLTVVAVVLSFVSANVVNIGNAVVPVLLVDTNLAPWTGVDKLNTLVDVDASGNFANCDTLGSVCAFMGITWIGSGVWSV